MWVGGWVGGWACVRWGHLLPPGVLRQWRVVDLPPPPLEASSGTWIPHPPPAALLERIPRECRPVGCPGTTGNGHSVEPPHEAPIPFPQTHPPTTRALRTLCRPPVQSYTVSHLRVASCLRRLGVLSVHSSEAL